MQALQEAIALYALRAGEKLRRQRQVTCALTVFIRTSPFKEPFYGNAATLQGPRFYGEGGLVAGMTGSGVYRVFLAIFLAWFYLRSGGNLFLTCWMHATFSLMPTWLPTFEPGLVILWVLATAGIVFKDKMWSKKADVQPAP